MAKPQFRRQQDQACVALSTTTPPGAKTGRSPRRARAAAVAASLMLVAATGMVTSVVTAPQSLADVCASANGPEGVLSAGGCGDVRGPNAAAPANGVPAVVAPAAYVCAGVGRHVTVSGCV
jgi:hypothetical protein